jgi:hypothetical protein
VRRLAADLSPTVMNDAAMNIVSIAGSEAVALGAAWAFGAAGLCAANSWWNFGIGLAVGVIAAIIIDSTAGEAGEDAARMRVHAELVRLRWEAVDAVVNAVVTAWQTHASCLEQAASKAVERSLE